MKISANSVFVFLGLVTVLISSCADSEAANNQLSEREKRDGWILLFDGKTTNGWHLYNKGIVPSGWIVQNGELYCKADAQNVEHVDLVTDKEFRNFDLRFEWKISHAGNSGVFINVVERGDIPAAWASGPEYQLLEKSHADYAASEKKRPGCLYGFAPQINNIEPRPFVEWNQGRIKQENGKVEFYLNDVLTAEQDLYSQEWKDMITNSTFRDFPEFGKSAKGHIALQDWAKGVAFRNIKIKEL